MGSIFQIYASQGRDNYAELSLPVSDYEMLDMMERLRLEPGQLPYLEILEFREDLNYLERCLHEQPDIYQLNTLAKKLSEFMSVQELAAFEGLVGKEIEKSAVPIELPRLIDFAHSADCCVIAKEAVTDFQLGEFLVKNGFIEEVDGLPDSMLALLDYGRIGREHGEAGGGVYTGYGYAEQQSEVHCVSEKMDFQPKRPEYTILLNMAVLPLARDGQKPEMIQLRLPASEEQMRGALEKLGKRDWDDIVVSVQDCAIPSLNHKIYFDWETPQIQELARCLAELDAQGQLPKYKAILAANDCQDLSKMLSLAGAVDEYLFEPQVSGPEDLAKSELNVILCETDAETLLPHINLPLLSSPK